MFSARGVRFASVITALVVAFSMVSIDFAEARPRGSFGSRGTRTFQSAPPTTTVPHTVAPVQRSMTPQSQTAAPGMQQQAQSRGGFFGGFGGSLFRGLVFGGLLGMLFGGGFGGLGGIFSLFFQVLLIGGAIWLLLNFMRSRSMTPASAQGPGYGAPRQAHNPLGGLARSVAAAPIAAAPPAHAVRQSRRAWHHPARSRHLRGPAGSDCRKAMAARTMTRSATSPRPK